MHPSLSGEVFIYICYAGDIITNVPYPSLLLFI